jgi:2-C-methyl-D-erythritol 2,4-cyclodiphosphate synthase
MQGNSLRVGYGYDVHRLESGCDLWLGGIKIPSDFGAIGHSDADVLLHAISDAVLGAAKLRDIGTHFPDTDPGNKGIDSKKILKKSLQLVSDKGYKISNIDTTICLEKPKLAPYILEMEECISAILGVQTDQVSIKATTSEKMGFVGEGKGISAHAVALLFKE